MNIAATGNLETDVNNIIKRHPMTNLIKVVINRVEELEENRGKFSMTLAELEHNDK